MDHQGYRRRRRAFVSALVSIGVVISGFQFAPAALAAPSDVIDITVSSSDVDRAAANQNGLTFKGFGTLSANSTSALLMDYKAQRPEAYWELIEKLFGGDHPIFTIVKIELGNDRNNSTGSNVATMRTATEYPNVAREPGFQLAADASRFNPDIKVSLLRWMAPAWVERTTPGNYSAATRDNLYKWYKNTILAAYREYGIMVDSINPGHNEPGTINYDWLVDFANRVKNDEVGFIGAASSHDLDGNPVPAWTDDTEKELFHGIQTITSDQANNATFAGTMLNDAAVRDAVDIGGYHYSVADNPDLRRVAEELDKEVWGSEGLATLSLTADRPNNTMNPDTGFPVAYTGDAETGTGIGGRHSALEMANWAVAGFDKARRTLNIYQPAIGSFYEGAQYSFKELVGARDPWSGYVYYDGGMAVLEQFTQFAKAGWENEDNTNSIWRAIPEASDSFDAAPSPDWVPNGRAGQPSYLTLAAPDGSDFSTVIVNDSQYEKTYRIKADGVAEDRTTLELWETREADAGQSYDANYMKPFAEATAAADGFYTVNVKPWSIVTATTLDQAVADASGDLVARDGQGDKIPWVSEYTTDEDARPVLDTDAEGTQGVTDDAYLYADDFEYTGRTVTSWKHGQEVTEDLVRSRGGENSATPLYTTDMNGAFEVAKKGDGHVLRQQVLTGQVGASNIPGEPTTVIGDLRWANYRASIDVLFEPGSGRYAAIGTREQGGSTKSQGQFGVIQGGSISAAELWMTLDGRWDFRRYGVTVQSGALADLPSGVNFQTGENKWNNIAVQVAGDTYTAYINDVEIASFTDPKPQATGRVVLRSGFSPTQFDNLEVTTIPGYTPYYTDVIDDMHQADWDDISVPVLQFDDKWDHLNGQGMYEWQRTISNSTGRGASLTYAFTGTGLDLIGANTGRTTLDVTVDGQPLVLSAPTVETENLRTTFQLRGLPHGNHTVKFATSNDELFKVDAVGVLKANADSAQVDLTALQAAYDTYEDYEQGEYSAASWAMFAENRLLAQQALGDPEGYGLDAEGAIALAARMTAAADGLLESDVSPDVMTLGLTAAVTPGEIPATVPIDDADVPVTWNEDAAGALAAAAAFDKVRVGGITTEPLSDGLRHRLVADLIVLPSAELRYVVDSGTADGGSAVHTVVQDRVPGLLNPVSDQLWDGSPGDRTWGFSTSSTVGATPGSSDDWGSSWIGANYGQPISYHLTLPAGKYEVGVVQAPRAGTNSATKFYASVNAGGNELSRETATSDGAATPIVQTVEVGTDGIVDVEFGTDGTTGYNARLSLVWVAEIVSPSVAIEAAVTPRCLAGKAYVYVTAKNTDDIAVAVTAGSDYGTKSFAAVEPGKSASAAFASRAAAIPAGTVSINATGDGRTSTETIPYEATSCG